MSNYEFVVYGLSPTWSPLENVCVISYKVGFYKIYILKSKLSHFSPFLISNSERVQDYDFGPAFCKPWSCGRLALLLGASGPLL